MGILDAFRRRRAGGAAGVRARLEGAMAKRRLRGWQPPLENINSLVASGGPRLLARARELVVTNGYAGNACEAFAANLVGDGIKPSSLIEDAEVRDRVQRLWLAWTDEADADGLTDFYGLQGMVAREMFVAGECFVRLRPRRAEDGLLVPLQLQLLQSEMLPFEKMEDLGSGRRIRCGIEFDAIGRRLAYHFRRGHLGDSTDRPVMGSPIPETVRVPASEVLHIYRPIDAGQIRGLPHVAPAMVRLFLLDQYDDAELDRKKTAAMFAGFITKTAPEEALLGETQVADDGTATASLEPGTLQVLLPGEDVKFSSPADVGGGYEAFQYRTLLAVSASLGLPYHLVTGDVRQANYSSLRAELVEFRRRVEQLQHGVIAHQLCLPDLGTLDGGGGARRSARSAGLFNDARTLACCPVDPTALGLGGSLEGHPGAGAGDRRRAAVRSRPPATTSRRSTARTRPTPSARPNSGSATAQSPRRAGDPRAHSRHRTGVEHAILICHPRPCRGRGGLDL